MNNRKLIRSAPCIAFTLAIFPMVNWAADIALVPVDNAPIDRHALVTRHDIDWPSLNGQIPLGNGNFAFNADGTGLETVGGNTMSHWCWHNFPLPPGVAQDDIKPWATPNHGRLKGLTTMPPGAIFNWERDNPQPLNLGRIGFISQECERLSGTDVRVDSRHLELWTGLLTSRFTYLGQTVEVQTCVDPKADTVAVQVKSPLLRDARLRIMLDFPAPAQNIGAWVGDFSQITGHETTILRQAPARLELSRTIDDAQYQVMLAGRGFTVGRTVDVQPEIVSARYGGEGGGWTNVTAQVADSLHDHQTVTANNALCGDPALGHVKQLQIKYILNGHERSKVLTENDTWNIVASPHQFILTPNAGTSAIDFTCRFGTNAAGVAATDFAKVKTA